MATKIFVNLPVQNLERSVSFFSKLGFTFNPQFTDENATCMVIGEDIYSMLLVEKFFQTFTSKKVCDAYKTTEVITTLSTESRDKVDELVETAIKAGGKPTTKQDHGWMYERGFEDLDGHMWEILYMDENALIT